MAASPRVNYSAFADWLSDYPDAVALKRFRKLQLRNLLYYQAELVDLENELRIQEELDTQAFSDTTRRVTYRWKASMAEKPDPAAPETTSSLYRATMLKIRMTLEKYNEAVEQYKRISHIPPPERSSVRAIRAWLDGKHRGAGFLTGDDADVWDDKGALDELYGFGEPSGLAFSISRVAEFVLGLFHRGSGTEAARHIDTSSTGVLDRGISTVVASVLPVIPIVVFYFVQRTLVRIGLILVFTAVFAAILVIGLQMKPDTTLGITTAIAAIQVVYVGTTANDTST